ncbi:MAG TPA: hypothetical protein VH370_24765 [Humisphaera sp.]|jgi:hypothetical protein|nr:hypothetical protein [Humisphaera sp.]
MRLTLIQFAPFVAAWRRLSLTDTDLAALEAQIMESPDAGKVMSGTGGVRKIRFAPPSWRRGKSGASRVCYVYFSSVAQCYLLTIFTKAQKANLSAADKAAIKNLVVQARFAAEQG